MLKPKFLDTLPEDIVFYIVVLAFMVISIFDPLGLLKFMGINDNGSKIFLFLLSGFTFKFLKTLKQIEAIKTSLESNPYLKRRRYHIFISSPITTFLVNYKRQGFKKYESLRNSCLAVKKKLQDEFKLVVYYKGSSIGTQEELENFDKNNDAREESFKMINDSACLITILPEGELSGSILIEIGYALGRKIPCYIYYHKDYRYLPHLIRGINCHGEHEGSVTYGEYRDEKHLIETILALAPVLQKQ